MVVDNDSDADGVCDADEVVGCQDDSACNYNSSATDDSGDCTYIDGLCETCEDGVVVDNDSDADGVCDADEIFGCTDETALNYNDLATEDDNSCAYVVSGCTDSSYYEYDFSAELDDGSCQSKKGDYNLDGIVNNADLFAVLGNWLSSGDPGLSGDVNNDGIVNNADLFDVLGNWLQ